MTQGVGPDPPENPPSCVGKTVSPYLASDFPLCLTAWGPDSSWSETRITSWTSSQEFPRSDRTSTGVLEIRAVGPLCLVLSWSWRPVPRCWGTLEDIHDRRPCGDVSACGDVARPSMWWCGELTSVERRGRALVTSAWPRELTSVELTPSHVITSHLTSHQRRISHIMKALKSVRFKWELQNPELSCQCQPAHLNGLKLASPARSGHLTPV